MALNIRVTCQIDNAHTALRQFFLFGEIIRHTPAWGHYVWYQPGWLDRMTEFIRCCRDGQWLERVGLA